MATEGDVDFHSDEDGDLWLHSDDPGSASWRVVVVERDGTADTPNREEEGVAFPGLNYHVAFSAWLTGRDYCHIEVTDAHGAVRLIGPCAHSLAAMRRNPVPPCDRCGSPVIWLVAMMYDPETSLAGRLLKYCDGCRRKAGTHAGLVIPWSMFELEPQRLLELMYCGGAAGTDPDMVAMHLGVPPGPWVNTAKRALAKRHP